MGCELMIAQILSTQMTPEEYLAFEEKSPIKHEYVDGKVFPMAGGTDAHNTIALNAAIALRSHLRGTGCQVFISDVKVQPPNRSYYYPDMFVTCDPADRETSKYKRFPKLIIEVLSSSTEAFDRGDKFIDYQKIESLQEYVLIIYGMNEWRCFGVQKAACGCFRCTTEAIVEMMSSLT